MAALLGDEFNRPAEIMRSGKGGAILDELVTKRNRGVDNVAPARSPAMAPRKYGAP